jgi:hypothetical protein
MNILLGVLAQLNAERSIIEKAIAAIEKIIADQSGFIPASQTPRTKSPAKQKAHTRTKSKSPIHEMAYEVLKISGTELTTAEIYSRMRIEIGGKKPIIALNSILSRKPGLFTKTKDKKWAIVMLPGRNNENLGNDKQA